MKIEFRFNGNPQIILMPENKKEISLIKLAFLDETPKPCIDFQASENAIITITLAPSK